MLVECLLAAIEGTPRPAVLDLGTGSGAVALAVAASRADAAVTATDSSAAALAIAKRNAGRLGLPNLRFCQGDWYAPLGAARFDVIASNPPYVAEGDPALASLAHEPRLALVAGPDGLSALAAVTAGAASRLVPGGRLLLEHGAGQGAAVRGLLASAGFGEVRTWRDLAGLDRVTGGARTREAVESAPPMEATR